MDGILYSTPETHLLHRSTVYYTHACGKQNNNTLGKTHTHTRFLLRLPIGQRASGNAAAARPTTASGAAAARSPRLVRHVVSGIGVGGGAIESS